MLYLLDHNGALNKFNFNKALIPFCDHILFIILAKTSFHTLLAEGAYNPSVRPGTPMH